MSLARRIRTSVALVALMVAALPASAAGYRVVAHPEHVGEVVGRETLVHVFLRQAIRWADGSNILPVDQSLKSEVRADFSRDALGLTTSAVLQYWRQQLAAGRTHPPVVKTSDAEVLAFVSSTPGSIGYVSAEAVIGPGVKELRVVQ